MLDVTYYDFRVHPDGHTHPESHPDFERGCSPDISDSFHRCLGQKGLVESTLGSDGRPVCKAGVGSRFMPNCTSFEEWFKHVPGVNQAVRGKKISLTGVQEHSDLGWAAGEYKFESSAFFPIDDEYMDEGFSEDKQVGFGNEGREHNYHFCSEIRTVGAPPRAPYNRTSQFVCTHGITCSAYVTTGLHVQRFRRVQLLGRR